MSKRDCNDLYFQQVQMRVVALSSVELSKYIPAENLGQEQQFIRCNSVLQRE